MTFKECLRRLGRKCLHKAIVGVGQIEDHEMRRVSSTPAMTAKASPKSACASPGAWLRGTNISLAADPGLPNVILHDGVATRVRMLGLEPLENALARVPLLLRPLLVFFQNSVDDTLPGRQPGPPPPPASAADTQAARNNPASCLPSSALAQTPGPPPAGSCLLQEPPAAPAHKSPR